MKSENPPDEALIERIILAAKQIIVENEKRDPPRRRDQHAKHHGFLNATFTVLQNVPPELRHGVFAKPASYDAYIRYSNSSSTAGEPDTNKDGRGMAIKVMGVAGAPAPLPVGAASQPGQQDFILISGPAFFIHSLEQMADVFEWLAAGKPLPSYFIRHFNVLGFLNMLSIAKQPNSPLELKYFSQVPSSLGASTVKYQVALKSGMDAVTPTEAEKASRNHLRHVLRRQLDPASGHDEVVLSFFVQRKRFWESIERPDIPWLGEPVEVAQIRIPRQATDSEAAMKLGETTSFNVWNALEAHRPLGTLNYARARVYTATAEFREAKPTNGNKGEQS